MAKFTSYLFLGIFLLDWQRTYEENAFKLQIFQNVEKRAKVLTFYSYFPLCFLRSCSLNLWKMIKTPVNPY